MKCRPPLRGLLFPCVVALASCGGGGSAGPAPASAPAPAPPPPPTYSIGGTISGLAAGAHATLLDNNTDSLTVTANGSLSFATRLPAGAVYAVTVGAQPSGEVCEVGNGSGTVGSADVTTVSIVCAPPVWAWVGGSNVGGAAASYGTQGVASTSNNPGARDSAATWIDASGNFWLFGGLITGTAVLSSDLWKYDPASKTWAWVSGPNTGNMKGTYGTLGLASPGNSPGARDLATSWIDAAGNLWLFGGAGYDSAGTLDNLNDLWKYNPSTNLWTWMGGSNLVDARGSYGTQGAASPSNVPGARYGAIQWTDAAGGFWILGGSGFDPTDTGQAVLNDLWLYETATGLWTWEGGASVAAQAGSYGTMGVPSSTNWPGARFYATGSADVSGNLWLFGGWGYGGTNAIGYQNDLWKFDTRTRMWTWVSGSKVAGNPSPGVYGTQGVASATNVPPGRASAAFWVDSSGNLWLFGGLYAPATNPFTSFSYLNDLWEYAPGPGTWTWMNGSSSVNVNGAYGTQGVASTTGTPGARAYPAWWIDPAGNFWLFGGYGYDSSSTTVVDMNDLWEFQP
jgi:hypothetical protein